MLHRSGAIGPRANARLRAGLRLPLGGIAALLPGLLGPALLGCSREGEPSPAFDFEILDPEPGTVALADVDRDGDLDVLLRTDAEVRWYESPARTRHDAIRGARFRGERMAAGDVDGDGDPDLLTARATSDEAVELVWLENPRSPRPPESPESWPQHSIGALGGLLKDTALADLDGDGRLDAVAREHERTRLFFQDDAGRWSRPVVLSHASHEGLAIHDLDDDGDPDVVLNGYWFETPSHARTQGYTLHVIDRKWFTPRENTWRDNNVAVRVCDLDRDGLPDVLISQSELPGFPISIYSAESPDAVRADRWRERHVVERFDYCQTLDAADVDGDGDLDLLAASFEREPGKERWRNEPPYPISLFFNLDRRGRRWSRQDLSQQGLYAGLLGDVDGDGRPDVVGARSYWTGPLVVLSNEFAHGGLPLEAWTYIQVDARRGKWGDWGSPPWLRYLGLALGDVSRDGQRDILSGRYLYRSPGGDLSRAWPRIDLGRNVDGMLLLDVDGDPFADAVATALPGVYWLESQDREGSRWEARPIGSLPPTDHVNPQGYRVAQIIPGGPPEILLAAGDGIHLGTIPAQPERTPWGWQLLGPGVAAEGFGVGDLEGDGDLDIVAARSSPRGGEVVWFANPGSAVEEWEERPLGATEHDPDRIEVGDLNGDGRADVVVSEERWPGPDPDANLYWFEQQTGPEPRFVRHRIVTEYSLNSLDIGDIDRDGDLDVVTCEHKGPRGRQRLQIFENDGAGAFTEHCIDRGKECHLGARLADMDGDGDLDIVGIGWDRFELLHLWRNDATRRADLP